MPPTVRIHRAAFEAVISASIEMFKRECFGFVFGRAPTKSRPCFIITSASSLQYPKKLHGSIEGHTRSERRLKKFFALMPHYSRPLGRFHSHTEWGGTRYRAIMSIPDILSMAYEKAKIEFIIGISSRKKGKVKWSAHPNGSIRGSFGKRPYNYQFNINAYVLEYNEDEQKPVPVRLKIIAPEAIKALNRALKHSP